MMTTHLYGSKNSEFSLNKQAEFDEWFCADWRANDKFTIVQDSNFVFINSSDTIYDEPIEFVPEPTEWFTFCEPEPKFPGGDRALQDYIVSEIDFSLIDSLMEPVVNTIVYVRFIIDENGNATNCEIVRGEYNLLNQEVLRVIRAMPKWIPAEQNGKKYRVPYTLPIKFT